MKHPGCPHWRCRNLGLAAICVGPPAAVLLLQYAMIIATMQPLPAQITDQALSARDLFLRPLAGAGLKAGSGAAQYLGIRYNVLLLDDVHGPGRRVNPAGVFKTGDCFALEFVANRGGYLYVFAEGASGAWTVLHPPAADPKRQNKVQPGTLVQPFGGSCLEFRATKGMERLFVFLSNETIDTAKFMDLFRLSDVARGPIEGSSIPKSSEMAGLRKGIGARDVMTEMTDTAKDGEPPFSVYAVAEPPKLFVEIALRHQ